jgi:magnesium chelatase family protein
MEDGRVTISRAAGSMTFPADFMLVAAMNPCKCGYFGDPKRECRCSPADVQRYRDKISGPLLDRIDIHVEVPAVQYKDISSTIPGESSEAIRTRVQSAREVQRRRFAAKGTGAAAAIASKTRCNSRMTNQEIKRHCQLDEAAEGMMRMAMTELNFSARAYDRILKVARTIADLANSESIQADHVGEAIQYRTLDRNLWA